MWIRLDMPLLLLQKDLDTTTVKVSTNFYKTKLPADMIVTKEDISTSDEQVEKLTREYNIHYRVCICSLIYILSKRVDLSFEVHKLEKFSENPGRYIFFCEYHVSWKYGLIKLCTNHCPL